MKFRMVEEYRFWWPVKVEVPSATASGKLETQTFEVLFEAVPSDEVVRITEELSALEPKERADREHEALIAAVKDWRGVQDDAGGETPFSADNLKALLRWPFVRTGLYRAYSTATSGDRARLGN